MVLTAIRSVLVVLAAGLAGAGAAAAQDAVKKVEGHCEKKDKDGNETDIEAANKEECKKLGGKWQKGAPHGEHKKDGETK